MANVNGTEINLMPTAGMREEAERYRASKADRIKALQDRTMERPYPNEHAARLTDPDQYDEIRRVNDEGGPGVDFIYGIKDGKDRKSVV